MITSAKFLKGLVQADEILDDGTPQVAIIGRSNVGKSSIINAVTGEKELAKSSATPGRTREINVFSINKKIYLIDLPGYGFAKGAWEDRNTIKALVHWYLLSSRYVQKKVILVIDAVVGPTADDHELLSDLERHNKTIVIVANKIDKLNQSDYAKQFQTINAFAGAHPVIPFSAKEKIGVSELSHSILD